MTLIHILSPSSLQTLQGQFLPLGACTDHLENHTVDQSHLWDPGTPHGDSAG